MRITFGLLMAGCLALTGCGTQVAPVAVPAGETTEAVFNEAGHPTVAVEVPSMHCEGCCEATFGGMEGVVEFSFDDKAKIATLAVDEAKFDKEAMLEKVHANYADAQFVTADTESDDTETTEPAEAPAEESTDEQAAE
jgi:hypothetical protein